MVPKTRKPISWSTSLAIPIVPILVLLAWSAWAPRAQVSTPPARSRPTSLPLEQQLASIDAGVVVDADETKVTRFRYLLGELSDSFDVTPTRIAEVTVSGQEELRDKYGKEVKLQYLMERALDVDRRFPSSGTHEALMASLVEHLGE